MNSQRHEYIIRRSIQGASQLSTDLWNEPDCQFEVNELVKLLLIPGLPELLAIHEAAHEIYYLRAGCTVLGFESPRIIYKKGAKKLFSGQRARTLLGSQFSPQGDNWLPKLARAYAAGGTCSRRLTITDYGGDKHDRDNFEEMYVDCYRGFAVDKKDIDKMWLDAQADVDRDLNNESFRAQIKARAKEIMPQLFSWLDTPHIHP
jgi:hypothetical protein